MGAILPWKLVSVPFEYLGQRSYSLYLIHNSTELFLYRRDTGNGAMNALLWIALTFALAELSYRLVEKPFVRFARQRF